MTDSLTSVVVPYTRFVECQKRRQQVAAELMLDTRRTIDAEVIPPVPTTVGPVPQTAADKQI